MGDTHFLEAGDTRITDLVLICISIVADLAQIFVVIVWVVLHFYLVSKFLQLVNEWPFLWYGDSAHLVYYIVFLIKPLLSFQLRSHRVVYA